MQLSKSLHNKFWKNNNSYFWLFFILLIFVTSFMITRYSISTGHDLTFHYYRFLNLINSIKDGSFPIYLSPSYDNYGYATKLFYPDFVLLPFAFIGCVIGAFNAFQVMYFSITILCALLSYLCFKRILNDEKAACISAFFYTFCYYRLLDLYERASLAETITFTFIPLIFWGLYEIIRGDRRKWYILSIGFSLCLLSHVLSTFLAATVVVFISLIQGKYLIKEPKRIFALIISGLVSLILTAYFLYPYLEQVFNDSFNYELFTTTSLLTYPIQNIIQGLFTVGTFEVYPFTPSIGVILIIPLFLRFCISINSKILRIADAATILGLFFIFICSNYTTLILNKDLKIFSIIQFLWRYFEFASFFLALACGVYISIILKSKKQSIAFIFVFISLIIMTMVINSKTLKNYYNDKIDLHAIEQGDETMGKQYLYYQGTSINSEYYPKSLSIIDIIERQSIIKKLYETTSINQITNSKQGIEFNVVLNEKESLELPKVYYKGYRATLNGKEIEIQKSKNGLIEIKPNESGVVNVSFSGTFLQRNSIYITLLGFILLSVYILLNNRVNKNKGDILNNQ